MSDLTFIEADIPTAGGNFIDIPPAVDETPTVADSLQCQHPGCPNEVEYSGRGRKPKFCPEHKGSNRASTTQRGKGSRNSTLAAQAADTLASFNGFAAMGLLMAGLPVTSASIQERNDAFREAAYNALLTDEKLCRQILRVGGTSAKAGLVLAYANLAATVGPMAWTEIKAKRSLEYEDE